MQKNGYTSRDVSKAISGFCIILALIATFSLFSGIGKGNGSSGGTSSETDTGTDNSEIVKLTELTLINSNNNSESITLCVPLGITFQNLVRSDYDTTDGALALRATDNRACYNGYSLYTTMWTEENGTEFVNTYNTDIANGTFYYMGESAQDELAGIWVFNNDPEWIGEDITFNVDFSLNGTSYSSIAFSTVSQGTTIPIHVGSLMSYGDTPAYFLHLSGVSVYLNGWQLDTYRAVSITSKLAEVEDGDKLLAYLQANAQKQDTSVTTLITFTIEETPYQAWAGMTWGEWCDSDFDFNSEYTVESLCIIQNGNVENAVSTDGITADIFPSMEITANGEYKLTGYPEELPVWNGTDLTGTSWSVASGWSATAGYGEYSISGSLQYQGNTNTYTFNKFAIGGKWYDSGGSSTQANIVGSGDTSNKYNHKEIDNAKSFTITFTDGTDATNTSLISWLKANGELTSHQMPTPTLITFTIDGTTYQAEEGMTWYDWCNSEYNTDSEWECASGSDKVMGTYIYNHSYVTEGGNAVVGNNVITNGYAYGAQNDGVGGGAG